MFSIHYYRMKAGTVASFQALRQAYHKIPKISPGAYIFQRPFLRGLFLEGLIFRGSYVRREICISKSIGLAYSWKEFIFFALFYFIFEGNFQVQAPVGAYIWRCDLMEGFSRYRFGGAYICRGLYMRGLFFGILWYFFYLYQITSISVFYVYSISALQWLCNADKKGHNPAKRLYKFFSSLYSALVTFLTHFYNILCVLVSNSNICFQ